MWRQDDTHRIASRRLLRATSVRIHDGWRNPPAEGSALPAVAPDPALATFDGKTAAEWFRGAEFELGADAGRCMRIGKALRQIDCATTVLAEEACAEMGATTR